jgi:regulator of cell morphogenesis and NO signaling
MKSLKNWLYPETPLHTVLAIRPLALSVLEEMEVSPYRDANLQIGEACRQAGVAWERFSERLASLTVPARNCDWARLPICHLLDFLTQEHRDFIESFMPAIKSGFTSGEGRKDFLCPLHPLIHAWPALSASLMEHIEAEETFLFPKILRYAYCDKHHQSNPDFSGGSVKVFVAMQLMRNEEKQVIALGKFLDATAFSASAKTRDVPTSGLFHLLQSFQDRLIGHALLEREILFPLAVALEKHVYDANIQGEAPRIPAKNLHFA